MCVCPGFLVKSLPINDCGPNSLFTYATTNGWYRPHKKSVI